MKINPVNNDFIRYYLASPSNNNDYFTAGCGNETHGLLSNVNIPVYTILMMVQPQLLQDAINQFAREGFKGVIKLRNATLKVPECKFLHINHSEHPNVGVDEYGYVVALQHIFSGDELLINYNDIQFYD